MIEELKNFYNSKTVFISGHTGFKGSWLALWLKALGANVVGFSLEAEESRKAYYQALELDSKINSIYGDIRDFNHLNDAIECSKAETIFHLAAQPLVRASYADPIETYSTNVMGTVNLFEAARNSTSVKSIVNITTDKCYENKEWDWAYRESDTLGGFDPYSSSKACSELVSSAYRSSFYNNSGIKLATARAGNVVGGGDFSEDRIFPDIVEAISKNKPIVLRNPEAVRPWQHVLDALFGYLILGMRLTNDTSSAYSKAYNFSPLSTETVNVEKIVQIFIKKFGNGEYLIEKDLADLHEAKMLRLDSNLAVSELNWKPLLDLDKTLNYTVDWYKSFLNNPSDAQRLTLEQIEQFMKLMEKKYE